MRPLLRPRAGEVVDTADQTCKHTLMIEIDRERLAGAVRMKRQSERSSSVAAVLGISPATLNRVERGLHDPSSRTLVSICIWLDRDPLDFVRRCDEGERA